MITGAPAPVGGRARIAGSVSPTASDPPGPTKPFDTPGVASSTVVVSSWTIPPGVATTRLDMVPSGGGVAGLVTTSWATAELAPASVPNAQLTGPLPVHPSGALALTSVVSSGSVSVMR